MVSMLYLPNSTYNPEENKSISLFFDRYITKVILYNIDGLLAAASRENENG